MALSDEKSEYKTHKSLGWRNGVFFKGGPALIDGYALELGAYITLLEMTILLFMDWVCI